ncbi:receptor activity-modifying protein 2 [Hoplias malabaricus]|uniref:receptor activity-modifying protein 2 n=1 Tax=Hoplias malabaricus TaxID=27720 RepID=UPI0034637123
MELPKPSPVSIPVLRPPLWVVCMVLMVSGLHGLIPNGQKDSVVRTTPFVPPGVQTTPLTTTSGSVEESVPPSSSEVSSFPCGNKTCELYCGFCKDTNKSRNDCYEMFVTEFCLHSFETAMTAMNRSDWCVWDKVKSPYNKMTLCTEETADCLLFPWPNKLVETTFVEIHTTFFQECPTESLSDPPPNVVFALVMTPICLIPAMVVLVVLKTKNGDRSS